MLALAAAIVWYAFTAGAEPAKILNASAATFGKTTVGASVTYASANWKLVSKFTLTEPGAVSTLVAYVYGTGTSGSQPLRAVIYADAGGVPGALMATSQEVTLAYNARKGWVTFPLSASVTLPAGNYWLGLFDGPRSGDALVYYAYEAVTSAQATNYNLYANGPTNPFGPDTPQSRQMSVYASYTPSAPLNTTTPTISGTPAAGSTLTADPGTWSGSTPISYAYEWRRCDPTGSGCSNISGASGQTYTTSTDDVGSTLRVAVTATNSGGSGTAVSDPTPVISVPPSNVSPPTISGQAVQGSSLTASPGVWNGTPPIVYAYQWQRCDSTGSNCVDIAGASSQNYSIAAADVGLTIRVSVAATNVAGSATAASETTADVAGATPPANTTPPSISGTVQQGHSLTADPGTWTGTAPISYTYQWRRCDPDGNNCIDLAGATSQTHLLTTADISLTMKVAVTATNIGGSAASASTATAPVAPADPPTNTSPPTLSGALQVGQTLTADPGSWSGTPPIAYAYQWRRCDQSGNGCVDIVGAIQQSYLLTVSDADSTIRVEVAGSNVADASTATSAATGTVFPPSSFGKTTIGATSASGYASANWKLANKFTLTESGSVSLLRAYLWGTGSSGSQPLRAVIYADSGGTPTALLATSQEVTINYNTPKGWILFPLNSPVALPPGDYWLGLLDGPRTGTALTYYAYDSATNAQATAYDTYSDGASNPFGSVTWGSKLMSIYAGYTAGTIVPPSNTSAVAVTGTTQDGYTLSASSGTWAGSTPITLAYQWQRCDSGGSSCGVVPGATGQTYGLSIADVGSTLRVVVTARNPAGSATSLSGVTAAVNPWSSDLVVAAAGDIACDPLDPSFNGGLGTSHTCQQAATASLLAGGANAVLPLGDLQYNDGELGKFLQSYDPSWGTYKNISYPVPGDEDYGDPSGGAAGYFNYWGARAGDPAKGYYSFDLGAWHIIALNSKCSLVRGCGNGSPEETWLQGDLAAHPAQCTLAYWHRPRFTAGTFSDNTYYQPFWQDLYDAGAELVLNGSDHIYERYAPMAPDGSGDAARGLREFVVGTGGKDHGTLVSGSIPNREAADNTTFGVLKLSLHAHGYDWQFAPTAAGGFTDSGSGSCH